MVKDDDKNDESNDSDNSESNGITKEDINKKIDEMILLGEIDNKKDLLRNQEALERFSKRYPELSTQEIKEMLGLEEQGEVRVKLILPRLENPENEVTLYRPKWEMITPDISERTKAISNYEETEEKSLLINMMPLDIFEKNVLPNLEKMVTDKHLVKIKHAGKGVTPYLTALIAKDIISTYMNIRVSVDTMVYVVPILGDVKVRCSATIIDMNRNTYVDGIIAEEYLLKRRGIDPDTNSEILIYGDESRVEVCNTVCFYAERLNIFYPRMLWIKSKNLRTKNYSKPKRKVSERKKLPKSWG